jgi:AcrR family transcriptional regulator
MDKRENILDATLQLVTEQGLYDTPMSQVAKKAKVAAGTIYHYFENKEQLILELYHHAKEKMGEALVREHRLDSTYQERFAMYWRDLFRFYLQNERIFKFLEQFDNSPFYNKVAKESHKKYYQPVIDFLEQGMKTQIIESMDVALAISLLHGSIASLAKAHLTGEYSVDQARLYQAIRFCWKGLKK